MPSQPKSTVRIAGPAVIGGGNSAEVAEVTIPAEGCAAILLAEELHLPLKTLRAVMVNHQTYSLDHRIEPGDLVAFVTLGTSGYGHRQSGGSASAREGK